MMLLRLGRCLDLDFSLSRASLLLEVLEHHLRLNPGRRPAGAGSRDRTIPRNWARMASIVSTVDQISRSEHSNDAEIGLRAHGSVWVTFT